MKSKVPKWYTSSQKKLNHFFTDENLKETTRSQSPCEKFVFVVQRYQAGSGTYFQGILYQGNEEIAKVNSNAYCFWYCWVQKDKDTYLICNQVLCGYVVLDMKGNISPHIEHRATSGWAFSWKVVKPSPDGRWLAVQGDYMEGAREVALYDFSNPAKIVKVRTLDANLKQGHYVLKGWENNKIVVIHVKVGTETTLKIGVKDVAASP